jgi:hypothetical protein
MSALKLPVILLAALIFVGCRPLSSEHPLGHRSSGEDLVRNWAVDDIRLEITRLGPEKLGLKVMSQKNQDKTDAPAFYYEALPSIIDDKSYLSIKQLFPEEMVRAAALEEGLSQDDVRANFARQDERANGYFLARYKISEKGRMHKLNIYLLDQENKMALRSIRSGELTGGPLQVSKINGKMEDIVYITSSSDALDAYIITNADRNMSIFDLKITGLINVR